MSSKSLADKSSETARDRNTLRRRLLRFILIPLLVSLIIAGSISFLAARKETAEIYDRQLVLLAQVLHSLAIQEDGDEVSRKISRYDAILAGYGKNTYFYRIWLKDKLALTSPNARKFRPVVSRPGFSNHKFGDDLWRVFVFKNEKKDIVVEVAGKDDLRTDIIQEILLFMFIPLLLVIPVIAGLVWFGVVRGLAPISVLSGLIKSRDPYNLSPFNPAEIPRRAVPDEIIPLVDALNNLMMRMSNVLETEKKFTDHAAHELRTPLAAIKVQAQVALRTTDSEEKQQMLEDLVKGVDRASHLVSQLLSLARAQSQQVKFTDTDLSQVLEKIITEFGDQFHARKQVVKMDIQPHIAIMAIEELLDVLVRNLLDNANKYSPDGSTIHISLACRENTAVFVIKNPGPGIPESEQENVFNSFYRLAGNIETGCGLGLALVKRVCELHNAGIGLTSQNGNGLTCFTIRFKCSQA